MSMIIHFANMIFKPIINLGAAPMMMIVLTLIALCFKVKFSKALEGGIKLAIALTAIGSVIGVLTTQFQDALNAFVKSTGINLSVTDVGWDDYLGFSVHAVFFVGNGCRKYYHACAQ